MSSTASSLLQTEVPALDIAAHCEELARRARDAARGLATASMAAKNDWLVRSIDGLARHEAEILEANSRDVAQAQADGLAPAQIDRLRLDSKRLAAMVAGL